MMNRIERSWLRWVGLCVPLWAGACGDPCIDDGFGPGPGPQCATATTTGTADGEGSTSALAPGSTSTDDTGSATLDASTTDASTTSASASTTGIDTSSSSDDDTTVGSSGGGCESDDDCSAPTPVCDLGPAVCVECLDDLDCVFGEACDPATSTCAPSCDHDADCSPHLVCDVPSGGCVPPTCLVDLDCPTGSTCARGSCVATPCVDGTDCPADSSECDPDLGLCVPGPGSQCDFSGGVQCGQGSYGCANGYCVSCQVPGNRCLRCAHDPAGACNAQHVCNVELDACVDCVQGSDCTGPEACQPTGECAAACSGAGQCPGYARCDQYGRCGQDLYGTECRDDADCPGMQCVQGSCMDCVLDGTGAECQTCLVGDVAGQCGGALCDFDLFVCVTCRDDDDCGGATPVCSFGSCQAPCLADGDCAALPGATCDPGTNACVLPPAPACAVDAECVGFGAGSEVICTGGLCHYP